MSDISDYRVNHLLLLVGSNPVPNVVAGKLLTTPKDTITLIHSAEGLKLAQRLKSWFVHAGYSDANIGFKPAEESDAASVYTCVHEVLERYERRVLKEYKCDSSKANKTGTVRVGLNYTGGTKVMSVHSYRALESWAEDNRRDPLFSRDPVFSYLDARTLRMRFDEARDRPAISFYVGLNVSISIRDLLDLHNWEPIKAPITEPVLPESAKALLAIYSNPAQIKIWNDWRRNELFREDGNPQEIPWPNLRDLRATMGSELGQHDAQYLNLTTAQGRGRKDENGFRDWSTGAWLESAVLLVLQKCAHELHLEGCCMDIKPKVPGSLGDELFQFDVAAMCGHQLFAFSCTTDSERKGLLKQKLFEADVRTRQMGGDEARTALVCCAAKETTDALEDEMRRDIILKGRIRVFGRYHLTTNPDAQDHLANPGAQDHLANLAKHMKKWISEQSGARK